MKKFLAYLLVAMMLVSSFAACGNGNAGNEETSHLKKAADYIYAMYKDKGTTTSKDFERTAQVMIGTTKYAVEWTTDNEAVKVTTSGAVATIDVDEKSAEDVNYTLTATVTDAEGNKESVEFKYFVPKFEGYKKIVEDAYKLENGESLDGEYTLEGVITAFKYTYSPDYATIQCTIVVDGLTEMPIECYKLGGEDIDKIAIGDTIKVSGPIKNYSGMIEFNGCTLMGYTKGEGTDVPTPTPTQAPVETGELKTPEEIVNALYALTDGQSLTGEYTLEGVIDSFKYTYSPDFSTVQLTIIVNGMTDKPIVCYKLGGEGIDKIEVGDTITVTGPLKNYMGTFEFNGCTLVSYVKGTTPEPTPEPTTAPAPVAETVTIWVGDGTAQDTELVVSENLYDPYQVNRLYEGHGCHGIKPMDMDYPAKLSFLVDVETAGLYAVNILYAAKTGDAVRKVSVYVNDVLENTYAVEMQADWETVAKHTVYLNLQAGENDITLTSPADYDGSSVKNINVYAIEYTLKKAEESTDTPAVEKTSEEILKALYALNDGESLEGEYTLTGVIDSFKYTYNPQYDNIQCTIVVDGLTEYPVVCYKLKGADIDKVEVGDTITVTGPLKNYKGMFEFNGCTLDAYTKAGETPVTPEPTPTPDEPVAALTTPEEIISALYALNDGESLEGEYTLTGVIDSFKYTYSPDFATIQLTIIVNGMTDKPIVCYKLGGEGIDKVEVGDTITVTGPLKNYMGTFEFNGCTLVSYEKGAAETPAASAGLDLSAGLTAGTDYNGISVFEDFVAKEDGREIDGVAYTYAVYGSTNASPKGGAVPETGAVVKVAPTANGTFTIVFKLNSGKQIYFVDGDANQIGYEEATENSYLTRTYNVEAGKVYYFYGQGTKPYIYKLSLEY